MIYQGVTEHYSHVLGNECIAVLNGLINGHVKLFCSLALLKTDPIELSELCASFQHIFPVERNPIGILKDLEEAGMTTPMHFQALSDLMPRDVSSDNLRRVIKCLKNGNMASPEHLIALRILMPRDIDVGAIHWNLMYLINGNLTSVAQLNALNNLMLEGNMPEHVNAILLHLMTKNISSVYHLNDLASRSPKDVSLEEVVEVILSASLEAGDE